MRCTTRLLQRGQQTRLQLLQLAALAVLLLEALNLFGEDPVPRALEAAVGPSREDAVVLLAAVEATVDEAAGLLLAPQARWMVESAADPSALYST